MSQNGQNPEFERLEETAETFVFGQPDLQLLDEGSRQATAGRMIWMMQQVGVSLKDAAVGDAFVHEFGMYFATRKEQTPADSSMPRRVLAVIGVKTARQIDYECVLATPENWQGYLDKLEERAA